MNRIKYWLLCRLLNELCRKHLCRNDVCVECPMFYGMEYPWDDCGLADIYKMGRKVWKIGERRTDG